MSEDKQGSYKKKSKENKIKTLKKKKLYGTNMKMSLKI